MEHLVNGALRLEQQIRGVVRPIANEADARRVVHQDMTATANQGRHSSTA